MFGTDRRVLDEAFAEEVDDSDEIADGLQLGGINFTLVFELMLFLWPTLHFS